MSPAAILGSDVKIKPSEPGSLGIKLTSEPIFGEFNNYNNNGHNYESEVYNSHDSIEHRCPITIILKKRFLSKNDHTAGLILSHLHYSS